MAWVLTRGLTTVRSEFNEVFPQRDKRSDGSVGDLAHQGGKSGHNPDRTGNAEYKDGDLKDEVRAIDTDRDLVPDSGVDWMELVIQHLVERGRSGTYIPFRYMIYKGRIWLRSDRWLTRLYTGVNSHDEHAHFSGDYTQFADEWTGSLGLAEMREEIEDTMSVQDVRDYFASAARGVRGGGTSINIQDRKDLVDVMRFAWGLAIEDQTGPNLAPARFSRLDAAVAEINPDESALAAALAPAVAALVIPALVAAVEANDGAPLTTGQVTEAVKTALREGTG